MPQIVISTNINAPVEIVFDLSRSIDFHQSSTRGTGEKAVGGIKTGLIQMSQSVTWQARHLGVRQHLTSIISAFDPPHHFRDTMVSGAFRRLVHDHYFRTDAGVTVMKDVMDYTSPMGVLGRLADVLFLARYMRNFLWRRNQYIKQAAESDDWKKYLNPSRYKV